jgi:hypothetical protein
MPGVQDYQFSNLSFSGADMVATCYIPLPDGYGGTTPYTIGSLQTVTYSIHMDRKPVRAIGNINAKAYVMGPRTIAGTLIFAVFDKHFAYEAMSEIKTGSKYTNRFLADELPPFNITISFANEYGIQARMALYGVQIVNEGQVMSINDIYTENTYQFVATDIEYLSNPDESIKDIIMNSSTLSGLTYDSSNLVNGKELATGAIINSNNEVGESPNYRKDDTITLSVVNIINGLNQNQWGAVELKLMPIQISGNIIISSYNQQDAMLSVNGQSTIGSSLIAGDYTAQYVDTDATRKSNIVAFSIKSNSISNSEYSTPPVIDFVSKDQIKIYCNIKSHDIVKYAVYNSGQEDFLDYNNVPIVNRVAVIDNLIPGVKYTIYTYSQLDQTSSHRILITTPRDDITQYNDLKAYLRYNSNVLNNGTISEYEKEADNASVFSQGNSMHAAVFQLKKVYEDQMANLNESYYLNQSSYDTAINVYLKKISICADIVKAAEPIVNNMTAFIASDSLASSDRQFFVKQPRPKIRGGIDGVFTVDPSATSVEIYKRSNIDNMKQTIKSFSMNNNEKIFTFFGDPGERYVMRSISSLKYASPLYEFYSMKDSEKTLTRNEVLRNTELQNNGTVLAEQQFGMSADALNLSADNRRRVITESSKTSQQLIFPKPEVLFDGTDIVVDINAESIMGTSNMDFYVVLSEINAVYDNTMKQKIRITQPITQMAFNSYGNAVENGKTYCVWVENTDYVQVSDSTTFIYKQDKTDNEISEEEDIRFHFVTKKIDQIRRIMLLKIGKNDQFESILLSAQYDADATIKDIYEYLASKIMTTSPTIPHQETIIKNLYESKMALEYCILTNFFDSNVKVNRKDMKITFPETYRDYMITSISIMSDGSILFSNTETSSTEKQFTPTGLERFVISYASENNISNKSGFVFMDILAKDISQYKLAMEMM